MYRNRGREREEVWLNECFTFDRPFKTNNK